MRLAALMLAAALVGCSSNRTEPVAPGEAENLVQRMERSLAETMIASALTDMKREQPELATQLGESRPDWNVPAAESSAALARAADQLQAAVDLSRIPARLRRDIEHIVYGASVFANGSAVSTGAGVDPVYGPHVRLPRFLTTVQPLASEADLDDYIARADAIGQQVRASIRTGGIIDRPTLQKQCEWLTANGADWLLDDIQARIFRADFALPASPTVLRQRFDNAFATACELIRKAPNTAERLPLESNEYAAALYRHTSRSLEPASLHQTALDTLARADGADAVDQEAVGQVLLDQASGAIFDAESRALALFGREATTDLDIRLLDRASDLGSAGPGTFVRSTALNTALLSPALAPRFGISTSALRLSIPGNHLMPTTPLSLAVPVPAATEGWALYAAALMDAPQFELHLRIEAVRTAVDTGIHTMGWSREQALRFAIDNTPFDADFARQMINAIEAAPGSGVAAFAGYQMFRSLELQAREMMGNRFELPALVERLIGEGPRPYSIMLSRLAEWRQATSP